MWLVVVFGVEVCLVEDDVVGFVDCFDGCFEFVCCCVVEVLCFGYVGVDVGG